MKGGGLSTKTQLSHSVPLSRHFFSARSILGVGRTLLCPLLVRFLEGGKVGEFFCKAELDVDRRFERR